MDHGHHKPYGRSEHSCCSKPSQLYIYIYDIFLKLYQVCFNIHPSGSLTTTWGFPTPHRLDLYYCRVWIEQSQMIRCHMYIYIYIHTYHILYIYINIHMYIIVYIYIYILVDSIFVSVAPIPGLVCWFSLLFPLLETHPSYHLTVQPNTWNAHLIMATHFFFLVSICLPSQYMAKNTLKYQSKTSRSSTPR